MSLVVLFLSLIVLTLFVFYVVIKTIGEAVATFMEGLK